MQSQFSARLTVFGLGLFFAFFTSLQAQITTSSIEGYVYNTHKQPLSNAQVTLIDERTNLKFSIHSDDKGHLYLNNINPGNYTIIIEKEGFMREELHHITLKLGENNDMDFSLNDKSETLEGVEITHTKKKPLQRVGSTSVNEKLIHDMPNISRSLSDLTRLTPESNNNSFAGANYRYNNITLDGAVNNDAIGFSNSIGGVSGSGQAGTAGSGSRANPYSMDVIKEIQVQLSDYDTRVGNAVGGTVNAVTKNGGNTFHADAYLFFRNAALVGRSNDNKREKMPPNFHDYQYGVSFNGPIIKNKLFYFANIEITQRQDPVFFGAGDPNAAITREEGQKIVDHLKSKYNYDPGNFTSPFSIAAQSYKGFLRLDWHISSKHQWMIRSNYTYGFGDNLERSTSQIQFGSTNFKQVTQQINTVTELRSQFSKRWSNKLIASFIRVHDFRDFQGTDGQTSKNPSAFIEINDGRQIWFGTWREASVYDQLQHTLEFSDHLSYKLNKHKFTLGTHNEFYFIQYGFVNAWNGRWQYNSIQNFLDDKPTRIRATYNIDKEKNTLQNNRQNPAAQFNINFLSLFLQDDFTLNNKLSFLIGLRLDAPVMGSRPYLEPALAQQENPSGNTFKTPPAFKSFNNTFLSYVAPSPRFSFTYKPLGNNKWVIKGGSGIFVGRFPLAWLGYAYSNSGNVYGNIDQRYDQTKNPTVAPLVINPENLRNTFVKEGAKPRKQLDLVANNFKLPTIWRSSLGTEIHLPQGWEIQLNAQFNKTIYDVFFQQINQIDNATFLSQGPTQTPIYSSGSYHPDYTTIFLLTNTSQGYRYNVSGSVQKIFSNLHIGSVKAAIMAQTTYTYGRSYDVANGVRNSFQSNYEYNPTISPNRDILGFSNFDLKHRMTAVLNLSFDWHKAHQTVFSFFYSVQSGQPYSWIYSSGSFAGARSNTPLAYIPANASEITFKGTEAEKTAQWQAFNDFIEKDPYLKSRRGKYAERNGARTPANHILDMKIIHYYSIKTKNRTHRIAFHYTINNLLNLLSGSLGKIYFVPNTNNASLALLKAEGLSADKQQLELSFKNPPSYTVDALSSRWQMQVGIRYEF